jgi:hypothetical protein
MINDEGEEFEIDDTRAIGPVYIGAFPSVQDGLYDYPHPEMGPIIDDDTPGNTYPYGGTTKGRFDYGCYESLTCQIVTGRYKNYDEVVEFFADVLDDPVTNSNGEEVSSGEEFKEHCYDLLYVTDDSEVLFIDDGEVDFVDAGDYYEADVTILHSLFKEGMAIWGWVDMPSATFDFSTCNPDDGEYEYYYNEQYYSGTNYENLLNYPGLRIDEGDWIVNDAAIITSPNDSFEVTLGYQYGSDDAE